MNNTENPQGLVGSKFNRLTIEKILPTKNTSLTKKSNFRSMVLCRCDCGVVKEFRLQMVKCGKARSCGCYSKEMKAKVLTKHNLSYDPTYRMRLGMIGRCTNPHNAAYRNYGGRGIKVCDEWVNDINSFVEWARKNGYRKGLQIDRIDVNGDYEPSNCRFVTNRENQKNKRTTKFYTYLGESKVLSEWSEIYGIPELTLWDRLNTGKWDFERAVLTSIKPSKNQRTMNPS